MREANMRKIEFRGKYAGPGAEKITDVPGFGWIYGYYLEEERCDKTTLPLIRSIQGQYNDYIVDPATVGQYVGRIDNLRNKIFEGDRVQFRLTRQPGEDLPPMQEGVICYDLIGGRFVVVADGVMVNFFEIARLEVIGNIHEQGGDK
jgi:hypothetical protein